MLCWTALSGQHSALRLWQAKANHTPGLISVLHKRSWGCGLSAQENKPEWEGGTGEDESGGVGGWGEGGRGGMGEVGGGALQLPWAQF